MSRPVAVGYINILPIVGRTPVLDKLPRSWQRATKKRVMEMLGGGADALDYTMRLDYVSPANVTSVRWRLFKRKRRTSFTTKFNLPKNHAQMNQWMRHFLGEAYEAAPSQPQDQLQSTQPIQEPEFD